MWHTSSLDDGGRRKKKKNVTLRVMKYSGERKWIHFGEIGPRKCQTNILLIICFSILSAVSTLTAKKWFDHLKWTEKKL